MLCSQHIEPRRVVVTGIGVITPIGCSRSSFWESLANGRGGVNKITRVDASDYPSRIAAEIHDFDPTLYLDRKDARHMDLFCQFGFGAGVQAVEDSGVNFDHVDRDRVGVIIGSGIGGMYVFEQQLLTLNKRGPRRMNPYFIPMMISDIIAGHISIRYNVYGPNYATTSACATSGHAIGLAMKTIRYGDADMVISGGAEAPICPTGLGGFCAMKALSTRNEEPEKASRPFDAKRDGFIMGEGAGMVVLEEMTHAQNRGAHIYAEIAGVGFTGDGHHITAPPEDGKGAFKAMQVAMKDGGISPEEIGYINAHGTSTPMNDVSETRAIKSLFGDLADDLIVSSTKSMHGHLLGAAGGVELIATILAMNNSLIPPTINYEYPDPDCDLNYAPNTAVEKSFNVALCNTFGFGGHNATLAVRKVVNDR